MDIFRHICGGQASPTRTRDDYLSVNDVVSGPPSSARGTWHGYADFSLEAMGCGAPEEFRDMEERILYVDHLNRADQERARKMSTEWGTGKWDEMEVPGTFSDTQSFPTDKAQKGMRGSLAQLSSKGSMIEGRHRMRVATKAQARRGSVEDIPGSHHIDIPKSSLRHSRGAPIAREKTVRASKDDRQPTTLGFDRQRQTRSQVVEI